VSNRIEQCRSQTSALSRAASACESSSPVSRSRAWTASLSARLLAGIILLILCATGLGTAVKFIPRPVVVGFTNGIAVIIASTQLRSCYVNLADPDKLSNQWAHRQLVPSPESPSTNNSFVYIVLT
jgi:MFS superfamily sulfate permease-like transporter